MCLGHCCLPSDNRTTHGWRVSATVFLIVTVSGVAVGVVIQMEPIRQEWEWM